MMARSTWTHAADVVVIGTGVAGLAAALAAHRAGRSVVVLNKADQTRGATATHYAQGGIAVVLPDNSENQIPLTPMSPTPLRRAPGCAIPTRCIRLSPTATGRLLN